MCRQQSYRDSNSNQHILFWFDAILKKIFNKIQPKANTDRIDRSHTIPIKIPKIKIHMRKCGVLVAWCPSLLLTMASILRGRSSKGILQKYIEDNAYTNTYLYVTRFLLWKTSVLLNSVSQPMCAPVSLFFCTNQSWSGLKYSTNADASILRWPVRISNASGQGFDDPNDSISLQTGQDFVWFAIFLFDFQKLLQCISSSCTLINITVR